MKLHTQNEETPNGNGRMADEMKFLLKIENCDRPMQACASEFAEHYM